jgi:tetraacyldisaccharide-1-P 4'-kinase
MLRSRLRHHPVQVRVLRKPPRGCRPSKLPVARSRSSEAASRMRHVGDCYMQFGVDADRVAAATRVLQSLTRRGQAANNVAIILDDGLQHRRIHRDLEVRHTDIVDFSVDRTGILTLTHAWLGLQPCLNHASLRCMCVCVCVYVCVCATK